MYRTVHVADELTHGIYIGYLTMVTDRLVALKRKLAEQTKLQVDALLKEQDRLEKLKEAVEGGLEKQNGWIMGQEMERKERETNVEEVTSTVLDNFEQQIKPLLIRGMSLVIVFCIFFRRVCSIASQIYPTLAMTLLSLR